jgi:hypothetical protein
LGILLVSLRALLLDIGDMLFDDLVALFGEQVPHGFVRRHFARMLLLGVIYVRHEYEPR